MHGMQLRRGGGGKFDEEMARPRRGGLDLNYEIEEGEIVPGYDSGSDSGDSLAQRYVLQPRGCGGGGGGGEEEEVAKRRRVIEDVVPESVHAPPSSLAHSSGSERTISDCSGGAIATSSPAAAVARLPLFRCRICQKEFSGQRAVNGHMKVHSALNGSQGKEKKRTVPVPVPAMGSSTEIARTDLADGDTASKSSSNHDLNPNESMAIVVVPADDHPSSSQAAAHPPAAPQVAALQPAVAAPPPAQEKGGAAGFTCKECGKWFATHQGLGGHAAGHATKRKQASGGYGKQEQGKKHVCVKCGVEYESGQKLGGHMRKHWDGEPLGGKKYSDNDKKTVTKKRKATEPPPPLLLPAPAAMPLPELAAPQPMASRPLLQLLLPAAPQGEAPTPSAMAMPLPELAAAPPPMATRPLLPLLVPAAPHGEAPAAAGMALPKPATPPPPMEEKPAPLPAEEVGESDGPAPPAPGTTAFMILGFEVTVRVPQF